jgi:hypothetical protein
MTETLEFHPSALTMAATHARLTNLNRILPRIDPVTRQEAVVLAAMINGINLMEAMNPIVEYRELRRLREQYQPVADPLFQRRYQINPQWYSIATTWDPALAPLFGTVRLHQFAVNEGWRSQREDGDHASFLMLSRITATFYLGLHPSLLTDLTNQPATAITLETNYDRTELISYGVVETEKFDLYTLDELIDHFRASRRFVNPLIPTENLEEHAVRKLKLLCLSQIRPMGGPAILNELDRLADWSPHQKFRDLYTALLDIEQYQVSLSQLDEDLKLAYQRGPREIDRCLQLVLELGLYMRGWKVPKSDLTIDREVIPLASITTVVEPDNVPLIMVNVTTTISQLEQFLQQQSEELRRLLLALPLMKLQRREEQLQFAPSTSVEDGLTILQRVTICKAGTSETSCIRTSSNYFLSSAYYYMVIVLGHPPPFNIRLMGNIS